MKKESESFEIEHSDREDDVDVGVMEDVA